jgi:hypothetical protein
MYQVQRPPRSEFGPIRNLRYHVQTWGTPAPGKTLGTTLNTSGAARRS